MEFRKLPPGTENTPEGRPYSAGGFGSGYGSGPDSFAGGTVEGAGRLRPAPSIGAILADIVMVTLCWCGAFIPLSLVTQLWAGSQYSPGQGGGLRELLGWSALFGAIVLVMVTERQIRAPGEGCTEYVLGGGVPGFIVGAVSAVVWFTSKNGPTTGDWFVGPACAAAGAAVALYIFRSR